jgi:hypothetical protein
MISSPPRKCYIPLKSYFVMTYFSLICCEEDAKNISVESGTYLG